MKRILLFLTLFFCIMVIDAQTGFVAVGGDITGDNGQWSYSVGLLDYSNNGNSSIILSGGNQQPYFLLICPETVTDYELNEYNVKLIAGRCWMTENYRSLYNGEGAVIPFVRVYNDDESNALLFGRLYTLFGQDTSMVRHICPEGWQLATAEDFALLTANYPDNYDLRSTTHWIDGNGTNNSGFNFYPGGYYNSETQRYENMYGNGYLYNYNSSLSDLITMDLMMSSYGCSEMILMNGNTSNGYSIRCVKQ